MFGIKINERNKLEHHPIQPEWPEGVAGPMDHRTLLSPGPSGFYAPRFPGFILESEPADVT